MKNELVQFQPDQINLIKRTVAKGASDDELKLFLHICKKSGLDPFARQIHAVKRWNSDVGGFVMVPQTGIDGYRLIAERTGRYAPGKNTEYAYKENGSLLSATAFIMKKVDDKWFEVSASAHYDEYVQTKKGGEPNVFWKTKSHIMLGKCAEALALRKAFPAELSGLYSQEEFMEDQPVEKAPDEPRKPQVAEVVLTPQELKYFHTQMTNLKVTKEEVKAYMIEVFGKESSKQLTKEEAKQIIDWASRLPMKETTK